MNVTRTVLPVMRVQRSGKVVSISSTAGIVGQAFCSAYAASKFGLEGWMESLRFEVEPFGIHTTIVEPGFFRTELLTKESTAYADLSSRRLRRAHRRDSASWKAMSGKQTNDPAKLAEALITVVDQEQPPLRFVAGADAVETVEHKANDLLGEVDAYGSLVVVRRQRVQASRERQLKNMSTDQNTGRVAVTPVRRRASVRRPPAPLPPTATASRRSDAGSPDRPDPGSRRTARQRRDRDRGRYLVLITAPAPGIGVGNPPA